jgi:hypothetical protein
VDYAFRLRSLSYGGRVGSDPHYTLHQRILKGVIDEYLQLVKYRLSYVLSKQPTALKFDI